MSKYSNFSREELEALVEKQDKELASKKYGLCWDGEREPEQVVLDCANNLPILKRVKGKEIRTDDSEDNILIEGDNYHALTVLNYTHKEKIDVIYIDPPYNTGNQDFIYNDRYVEKEDSYRHSKWLNFMEKRLNLAKDLLKDTGVIFISIDENEFAQLKLMCDKIFGEENFIGMFTWIRKKKGSHLSNEIRKMTEYVIAYRKLYAVQLYGEDAYKDKWQPLLKRTNSLKTLSLVANIVEASINDGVYKKGEYGKGGTKVVLENDIIIKDGKVIKSFEVTGRYVWTQEKLNEEIKLGTRISINSAGFGFNVLRWDQSEKTKRPSTLINDIVGVGTNEDASEEIKNIFGLIGDNSAFDHPKPVSLIKYLVKMAIKDNKNAVVLDFMAGSGTTGHAVLELNKEDGGNRKFILCTNNELNGLEKELREKGLSEKEIQKNGICRRVCYPRLEKVINGYKNSKGEKEEGLGGNLQYFRTALVKKTTTMQTKLDITSKCTEMLCVKENIFNLAKEADDYKIFSSNKKDKFLCIYYNFIEKSFDDFLSEIKNIKEEKAIYIFSLKDEIDKKIVSSVENARFEAIPQKILKIYEEWVRKNIPIRNDLILLELDRAKDKIFEQKEKDESARLLRIVLEKIIMKISQKNKIEFLKENAKTEKVSILNDKLKSKHIFSKVEWEENKTFLAIGNYASHGEYGEYNLDHIKSFYKHIQLLLNKFNIK